MKRKSIILFTGLLLLTVTGYSGSVVSGKCTGTPVCKKAKKSNKKDSYDVLLVNPLMFSAM